MHNFLFYHLINKDTVLFLSVEPLDILVKYLLKELNTKNEYKIFRFFFKIILFLERFSLCLLSIGRHFAFLRL